MLLGKATRSLVLPGCPSKPTLVNPAGDGFYRVACEPRQHSVLTAHYAALPAAAQVALLTDTFALAQSGRLPMAAYPDLLAALQQVQGPGRVKHSVASGGAG